jgi:hypothetical protein
MSTKGFLLILTMIAFGGTAMGADLSATTEEGKKVLLKENGTWKYVETIEAKGATGGKFDRSTAATEKIEILKGKAAVYYNPNKWRGLKETEPGRFELTHQEGDSYAMVIAERMQMPVESLRNIALSNAREAAPDIQVVAEERRKVNGSDLIFMQTAGSIQGMRITYLGHYYTGKAGSVQIIAFTGENLIDDYKNDIQEFLNGFQLLQQ